MKNFLVLTLLVLTILSASAQIPAGYYNTATGTGATLKTQLYNIIKVSTSVSYDQLWTSFQTTDKRADGKVWDMYSNCSFTFGSNQCGTYSGECVCYNREHSFPKSWFGGTVAPMYTDLFHLVPTDGQVNGMRGNYPFGTVSSPSYTSGNGSKLGPCSYPGYTGVVFEPVDEYKGDFARNYFYMATRYENINASWYANDANADAILLANNFPFFETWFLNMLGEWSVNDPVSPKETARNNAVYAIQNNRNPFIDHPEYVYQIWGVGAITSATLAVAPSTLTGFTYVSGSGPSASQTYNLSGTGLTGAPGVITITAPTHFEVSTNNSTFVGSVTVAYATATLASTPVYVRLKSGFAAGSYSSENITNSGGGATTVNVTCSGSVSAPAVIEPTTFPTNFSAHNIHLQWTDATGTVVPTGYLIRMSSLGFGSIATPVDGIPVANSGTDYNVAYGVQNALFSNLAPATTYYFKLFGYTGSGAGIDYKTDGTVPQIIQSTTP